MTAERPERHESIDHTAEHWPGLPETKRRHIRVILRRMHFLDRRIEAAPAPREPIDYDRAERAALGWLLREVHDIHGA